MEQLEKLISILHLLGLEQTPDQTLRKIKFWSYELQSQLTNTPSSAALEKLDCLRRFLFEDKSLHLDHEILNLHNCSFEHLLDHKRGCLLNMALIFRTLAADAQLQVELIRVADHRWLKWMACDKSEYLDLVNKARTLSKDEVVRHLVHSSLQSNGTSECDNFKPLSFRDLTLIYLSPFESLMKQQDAKQSLLSLYDLLLKISPGSLRVLSERALLLLDLGERKEAYQDLKRYFYLSDERTANADLKYLYELLSRENDYQSNPAQLH